MVAFKEILIHFSRHMLQTFASIQRTVKELFRDVTITTTLNTTSPLHLGCGDDHDIYIYIYIDTGGCLKELPRVKNYLDG